MPPLPAPRVPGQEVVLKEVARGDRELARLFVEMLEMLGPGLVPGHVDKSEA